MQSKKIKLSSVVLHIMLLIICAVCIYPVLLIVFNAFSSEKYIVENGYVLWPKELSIAAFEAFFAVPDRFVNATVVSIISAVGQPIFEVIVNSLAGYALMRDDFIIKKPLKIYYMLSMFLPTAGMISAYIINTQMLHLENNILAYLLPGAATPMSVFLYRTFFNTIPKEISESACIDGATPMQIWAKMMVPLSKSFIATQFFLGLSAKWKDYSVSLYYMDNPKLQNLEYYVQEVIRDVNALKQAAILAGKDPTDFPVNTLMFATVLLSLVPVMIIFPLLQKYFEKGAMVGSVKG